MKTEELIRELQKLKMQTGSLACLGCGHEHGCSVHGCAIIRAAAKEIEILREKVPKWIPVTEKIPPDQEEVLVLTRSKNGVRNVDKGYWAIDHFIHRGRSEVTHWMPLPGLPEEVNDE